MAAPGYAVLVYLCAALFLATVAQAGMCPQTCAENNKGIVVFPGNPWKELSKPLGSTMTLIECQQAAYKADKLYYMYMKKTRRCFATKRCFWSWGNAAGMVSGKVAECPKPAPDKPGYCSARMSRCRCRSPLYCRDSGDQKVCCCPDSTPNPIIRKRRLYGCKA